MSEKVMELKDKVQDVIEMIRPSLQADGGDIELVDVVDNIVQVRLQGACGVCPSSIYTLKLGVERMLTERIPEIKEVVAV
ncbi:MAG: NifU family protein [Nitrospirota bacterium]|jgi:Fe-S cluster biogenesis protein NfuA